MLEIVTDAEGPWSIVYDLNDVDEDGPHWTEIPTEHISDYVGRNWPNELYPLCWVLYENTEGWR